MKLHHLRFSSVCLALLLGVLSSCGGSKARDDGTVRHLLLVSIDTLRADHVGCYGGKPGITPNLDRLAATGIRFTDTVSPCPLTLPSHSTMLTGTIPPYHGVRVNAGDRLVEGHRTLAEVLAEAGYRTGGFVSTRVLDSPRALPRASSTTTTS